MRHPAHAATANSSSFPPELLALVRRPADFAEQSIDFTGAAAGNLFTDASLQSGFEVSWKDIELNETLNGATSITIHWSAEHLSLRLGSVDKGSACHTPAGSFGRLPIRRPNPTNQAEGR